MAFAAALTLTFNAEAAQAQGKSQPMRGKVLVRAPVRGGASGDQWTRFDALFKKYAAQFRIPQWQWLKAIAINESSLGLARSVAYGMKPSVYRKEQVT